MMTIQEIRKRVRASYGVELKNLDPLAACWVAEELFAEFAVNVYRKISRYRDGFGQATSYPPYGTPLFNSLCNKTNTTDES